MLAGATEEGSFVKWVVPQGASDDTPVLYLGHLCERHFVCCVPDGRWPRAPTPPPRRQRRRARAMVSGDDDDPKPSSPPASPHGHVEVLSDDSQSDSSSGSPAPQRRRDGRGKKRKRKKNKGTVQFAPCELRALAKQALEDLSSDGKIGEDLTYGHVKARMRELAGVHLRVRHGIIKEVRKRTTPRSHFQIHALARMFPGIFQSSCGAWFGLRHHGGVRLG